MEQTDNDIFPEKEKEAAKRKKIAEMNAVTAQAIFGNILNQLGAKYEQYHFRKYCVMIIPIDNSGIEVRISDSNVIKQRQAMQDKIAKLFDFISGGASIGEVVTYCHYNSFTYLGYKARKYAVIDKTSQDHNDSSFESAFVTAKVTSIGEGAFWGCELLKSIQLPAKVKAIEVGAFAGCSELVSINVDSNNPVYDSRENCNAIIETSTDTLIAGCQNTVIPVGVASIGESAFASCTSLKSIQLPEGLQSIGESAFWGCKSLESIQLPEGLQSIGRNAFLGCSSLESIQLPEGLQSIRDGAFWGCKSLKSIQLPEKLTSIGFRAFENCTSLENITFSGTRQQWEKIKKPSFWYGDILSKVVHCSDGEIEIEI